MGVPQILMIALLSASLLSVAVDHGKPKQGTYNVWITLISAAIFVGLLIWGGYFS